MNLYSWLPDLVYIYNVCCVLLRYTHCIFTIQLLYFSLYVTMIVSSLYIVYYLLCSSIVLSLPTMFRFIHYMTGWLVPHRYLGNGIQVCAPSLLRPCLGLISCTIIARNTKPGVWIHLGMAVSCTKSRALQPTFSPLTYF